MSDKKLQSDILDYKQFIQRSSGFSHTTIQEEFERFRPIQCGDTEKVKEIFKSVRHDFLHGKKTITDQCLRSTRYHMISSAAIVARLCVESGLNHDEAYTLSDVYIRKADRCETFDEMLDLMEEMFLDFASRMMEKTLEKRPPVSVRHCIDYIYDHLGDKLTIAELANHVGLNESYLSKLFASEINTPIHAFIQNARIDTAKNILARAEYPYALIASSLGFSSQSAFIAQFRKITGMTPKQYHGLHYHVDLPR